MEDSRSIAPLGRYEIVAEVGRGTMGRVYKARDPKIDRFVAVKTISLFCESDADERQYRERFFQEAKAAGRLLHPGIVTIFDVGEEAETRSPYIVMEYISGQSLSALLTENGGKVPLEMALRLAEEMAEALDYAHAHGVVHRDIKPANILVTTEGRAKIADFGIAQMHLSHLTLPGHALGTPAYMSPEQLNGERVDGRSDLFSLGVILYSMLSGHRPFQGNSVATVCFKLANRDPLPPTSLDPHLPASLDALMARALAKEPAKRYQRGSEFAQDLRNLRERAVPPQAKPNPFTSNLRNPTTRTEAGATSEDRRRPNVLARAVSALDRRFARVMLGIIVLTLGLGFLTLHRSTPSGPTSSPVPAKALSRAERDSGQALPQTKITGPAGSQRAVVLTSVAPKSVPPRSAALKPVALTPGLSTPAPPQAQLTIQIDHHFKVGNISLWIDDAFAYSHSLSGEKKGHFALFRSSQSHESDTVRVPTGEHRLRVRAQSSPEGYDEDATIVGSFGHADTRTLLISFPGSQKHLRLALQ